MKRIALLLLVGMSSAQTVQGHPQLDQSKAWLTCVKPNCDPGGLGIPTYTDLTPDNGSSPMRLDLEGPPNTNALWYVYTGPPNLTATIGEIDLLAYPTATRAQAYEYDAFIYAGKIRYMFGHQCDFGNGKWDVWDMLHGHWVATAVPCNLSLNAWHHVQLQFHRINGSNCDGYPCQYYDSITIDGHVNPVNMVEPSGPYPSSWGTGNNTGLNIQLDTAGASTLTEYIDNANLLFYGW